MRKALVIAALLLAPSTALAESKTKEELSKTLDALRLSESKNEALKQEHEKLQEELSDLQQETITIARGIHDDEKQMSALEAKLAELEKKHAHKTADHAMRERQLASVIQGMVRLSKMPEGAVIAMPGDYEKTLKTSQMLGITSKAIRAEADTLKIELSELNDLKAEVEKNKTALLEEKQKLEASQSQLATKLIERQKLQAALYREQQEESKKIAELSAKSSNLKELMQSLESSYRRPNRKKPRENKEFTLASLPDARVIPNGGNKKPFEQAKGSIKLPASGKILNRFGDVKQPGETYKGVVISTRNGAQVTAPYDGEVVFTGPFLDYGKLIIIRHSEKFHSLIAGLDTILCTPGQFLLEGEPIGGMGSENKSQTSLYLELRQDGKSVDPLPWVVAGL